MSKWKLKSEFVLAGLRNPRNVCRNTTRIYSLPTHRHTNRQTVVVESAGRVGEHAERRHQRLNEEFINAVH